ncbi:hypothetical protein N7E70_021080 [Aminobacter sp. NyZ550]|uniref:Uncharacterized protein n=1 Tax=Aminobacter ciceronei TaxID=150723 RepID=A0ABR6C2J3_9HYPH|nr:MULTISPECIES: hypothetical protein [Aminobacter]MBA8905499.1 hypothetical protein [Aminobacter ciceronei]MBA9019202.1 hypothetical protein [Aminobacter ciceronei]WAX94147.1 hypothetical protein N7E70_021080 [Aminobacter sp. NyZ550]
MQRIIYPNGDGVAVIIPAEKSGLPIEEIARKDVPEGVPYRIVATADVPTDRSQRELWTADFSSPDGHGIGAAAWLAEQEAILAAAHAEELGLEESK